MNLTINKQGTEAYIDNLAFIKAIFIREYVKSFPITKEEKEKILKLILQLLKES